MAITPTSANKNYNNNVDGAPYQADNYFNVVADDSQDEDIADNVLGGGLLDQEAKKSKTPGVPREKGMKGMMYMMISALSFSLMAFMLKLLFIHSTVTTYEVTYWQAIILIFFNYGLIKWTGKD